MANYPLEKEFFAYVYYLNAVQGLDRMSEFSLIKIVKDDNELPNETKAGLLKALGSFIEPTKEAAKEKLADIFRSPQARSRAVIIDTIIKLKEANISINEIPYEIRNSIFNGIEFGSQAEEIQSKWKKLLEASITGKPVRKDYTTFMGTLEPAEARLLDKIYLYVRENSLKALQLKELAELLNIKDYEEELLISIDKLVRQEPSAIEINGFDRPTLNPYEPNECRPLMDVEEMQKQFSYKGLIIEDREQKIQSGLKISYEYKILNLSLFGKGFMKIVSEQT